MDVGTRGMPDASTLGGATAFLATGLNLGFFIYRVTTGVIKHTPPIVYDARPPSAFPAPDAVFVLALSITQQRVLRQAKWTSFTVRILTSLPV